MFSILFSTIGVFTVGSWSLETLLVLDGYRGGPDALSVTSFSF
jgi:hypothetical protein